MSGYKGTGIRFSLVQDGYRGQFGDASYEANRPDRYFPEPAKPVEFMLIRDDLPKAERVFYDMLSFAWNGGPVIVNLGAEIGKLTLTPQRQGGNPANKQQRFDWSAEVQTDGFMITKPIAGQLLAAPSEGYDRLMKYNFLKSSTFWKQQISDSFAIRTTSGKYGLMELEIFAEREDNTICGTLKIYLNKSGARNIDHK